MGKPKAPKPPDPVQTGIAQTGTNVSTAIANQIGGMINQNTPYGSLTYDQTGSFQFTDPNSGKTYTLPRFTANQTLTPQGAQIQDNTLRSQINMSGTAADASGRLRQLMGQGMADAGEIQRRIADAGPITRTYNTDFSKDRQRVEEAIMSRVNPQMQQQRAGLEAQLRQQGLVPGSAAYDRAMDQANRMATDARMQAVLHGGQEQSRMVGLERDRAVFENAAQGQQFGQNATQAQFVNAAQAQQFGQNLAARNQSINEIQALLGGSQVQQPNYVNAPGLNMPTTDYAGLYQQDFANRMGVYGQKMNSWNGIWGGLMGAGANIGAAMLSDARAKTDIKRIGTADNGLPIYSYRYKSGGPVHIGVMAQDVLRVKPEAVVPMGDLMGVDYAEAFG